MLSNIKLFTQETFLPARRRLMDCVALATILIAAGCTTTGTMVPAPGAERTAYRQAVESPLRTDDDRASDASRKPIDFLNFAQVRPGMQVLDLATGGGTTAQLLTLAVGSGGRVYAQAPTPRPGLEKRLAAQPQANLIPVVRPFDDPMPPGAALLDLVTINLSYHDIANLPLDRVKMDRRLFELLKPGGSVVVIDHAAVPGSGASATRTLHRIDEALVRAEFEQAGFRLDASGTYLRNSADDHLRKSSDMERMTDRFALRFVKPGA